MSKKLRFVISLIIMMSMVLTACAPAAAPAAAATTAPAAGGAATSSTPIVIGLPAVQTGSDTYIHGELMVLAVNFAMDEINAKGGVLGRPLKALVMDDAGDPKHPRPKRSSASSDAGNG